MVNELAIINEMRVIGPIPVQPTVQTTDEHPITASHQMRKTKDAAMASDSECTSKRLS